MHNKDIPYAPLSINNFPAAAGSEWAEQHPICATSVLELVFKTFTDVTHYKVLVNFRWCFFVPGKWKQPTRVISKMAWLDRNFQTARSRPTNIVILRIFLRQNRPRQDVPLEEYLADRSFRLLRTVSLGNVQ